MCRLHAAAEAEQMAVKAWTTSDGLPSNEITALAQTTDGYLWVGTSAGLTRFDGARFKLFGREHGLSGMPIAELQALPEGSLWVKDKKMDRYWLRNGRFVRDTTPWHCIVVGQDGKTYGYSDQEVVILKDGVGVDPIPFPVRWSSLAGSLQVTEKGEIWMLVKHPGETVEVWFYADGRWREREECTRMLHPGSSGYLLGSDREGGTWFIVHQGDGNHVLKLNGSTFESVAIPSQFRGGISVVAEDGQGVMWAGTWAGGVWRWRGDEPELQPLIRSERQPTITALFRGSGGELWTGTRDEGLFLLRPASVISHRVSLLGVGKVTAIFPEDEGSLLVGTEGSGIYRWKAGGSSRLAENYVYGNEFLKLSQDSFWVATGGGVDEFSNGERLTDDEFKWRFGGRRFSVFSLLADGEGGFWAGGASGKLYHARGRTVEEIDIGEPGLPIHSLNRDGNGDIWVVQAKGAVLKVSPDGQMTRCGEEELNGAPLTVGFVDSKGGLWLGTNGAGLFRRESDRFVPVPTSGSRWPGCVMQIQEDAEGWLWLGTPDGICGFDPSLLPDAPPLVWLGVEDGMESGQCMRMRAAKDKRGRLYFGTTRGFSVFDPAKVKGTPVLPTPVIEEFNVGSNGSFVPWDRKDVPPGEPFEVTFTGLGPELAGDMQFRYRLAGLDEKWSEAKNNRTVMYSRVPPGSYRFELQAGRQGHWNTGTSMLPLRVAPFFWQAWWFRLTMVLALAAVVAGLIKQLERRQLRKAREQIERDNAVNEERRRIARDLHDSVGAGLTQVNMLTRFWEDTPASQETAVKLKDRLRSLSMELDNAVWVTNPAFDNLSAVCDYLVSHSVDYLGDSGICCEMDLPPQYPVISLSPKARQHLLQAVKEALANVVRHAGATRVYFSIRVEAEVLTVIVRDDGKGFDPQEVAKKGRNGLRHLQDRLLLAGGETVIETSSAGTSVKLTLPLRSRPGL